jgi:hypothetical protein
VVAERNGPAGRWQSARLKAAGKSPKCVLKFNGALRDSDMEIL